ncbi:MAG: hypothetical protein ACI8V4_000449, partial [Ilumatobacter sp.]
AECMSTQATTSYSHSFRVTSRWDCTIFALTLRPLGYPRPSSSRTPHRRDSCFLVESCTAGYSTPTRFISRQLQRHTTRTIRTTIGDAIGPTPSWASRGHSSRVRYLSERQGSPVCPSSGSQPVHIRTRCLWRGQVSPERPRQLAAPRRHRSLEPSPPRHAGEMHRVRFEGPSYRSTT